MVKSCVAAWCNTTCKDGVSLFSFPKNPELKKKWGEQVSRTRSGWKPVKHSRLCSCHKCKMKCQKVLDLKREGLH